MCGIYSVLNASSASYDNSCFDLIAKYLYIKSNNKQLTTI